MHLGEAARGRNEGQHQWASPLQHPVLPAHSLPGILGAQGWNIPRQGAPQVTPRATSLGQYSS